MKKSDISTIAFEKELVRLHGRSLTIAEKKYLDEYLIKSRLSLKEILQVIKKVNNPELLFTRSLDENKEETK